MGWRTWVALAVLGRAGGPDGPIRGTPGVVPGQIAMSQNT